MEIKCLNVNDGLAKGLSYLINQGVPENSRNGPVLVSPEPVLITYTRPWDRVLFSPLRNANPFFHMMESLWMLAGSRDLKWPNSFNSRFSGYSDDGLTINGAYGYRWRCHFGIDQLDAAVEMLQKDKETRRVVIGMWDPRCDLGSDSKDIPCNTHIYVDLRNNRLNITVCNRSNDVLWGAFGANAVHMSMLQEYLACRLHVQIGHYRQFTNNLHLYTDILSVENAMLMVLDCRNSDKYSNMGGFSVNLINTNVDIWQQDLVEFIQTGDPEREYKDVFFNGVASPMLMAWNHRKSDFGLHVAKSICDEAWKVACCEWLVRATEKRGK